LFTFGTLKDDPNYMRTTDFIDHVAAEGLQGFTPFHLFDVMRRPQGVDDCVHQDVDVGYVPWEFLDYLEEDQD
jgi:hypothetical protein